MFIDTKGGKMAKVIDLPTFSDSRGSLTVLEKVIGFDIKRVYYIYDANDEVRGGHRHKKSIQALINVKGSCEIFSDNGVKQETFLLDSPSKCLLLEPEDWHTMSKFTKDAVLLVLASEYYDKGDYIDEPYR